MRASLYNHRTAPRKVRLVADLVRGKSVAVAKQKLAFLPKKTAPAIEKLLDSAIANAQVQGASVDELFVKTITVNKGGMQKRYRPFARGRAGTIQKKMSHIEIELGRRENVGAEGPAKNPAKKTTAKKTSKKTAKKETK
jgi:large subunit ribosomal protein L22